MPAEGSGGSIRRTLWLYLGALSALGALVLFFVARGYGQRAADQSYDHLLVASALSIADSVALVEGQWQVDLPYAALDLLAMAPEDRVFYRVADAGGHATITGYADLPPPPRAVMPGQPLLFDAAYSGETVRFVTVARQVASASAQGEVWVQVGQTRLARNALAQDMVARALLVIGVLSLLSLALVGLGVHRALRPLVRIERDLARRDPSDLAPLGVAPPRELQRMVAALNHFMQRLAGSHEAQRAFMAEAAHQMRTPLAALRAQAQTALDEDEPAELRRSLATIERNANHMSRLLNQLLSDASVAHRADLRAFAQVDLTEVVRQAVAEALPQAGPRPSLRLALGDAPTLLRGDALLLREAVKNLIDNACKYAGEAPLEVTLHGEGDAWVLRVADRGPGVAGAEAGRLLERFTRGTSAPAGGAGLGLAIVRRVVEGHGGSVELRNRDGGGLAVTLRLPKGNSL